MTQRTPSQIGFVKLGDSDFVLENPEQDIRGKDVHNVDGQQMGSVEDLYIDRHEREVRYLEVGSGGFLGIGEKPLLIPVEAVVEVGEGRVTIEPGRTEREDGPAPFDTKVAPPPADDRSSDDYYPSPPSGNAEDTAARPGGIHSSFPFGRHPY